MVSAGQQCSFCSVSLVKHEDKLGQLDSIYACMKSFVVFALLFALPLSLSIGGYIVKIQATKRG
jgi:hypothetical protein